MRNVTYLIVVKGRISTIFKAFIGKIFLGRDTILYYLHGKNVVQLML